VQHLQEPETPTPFSPAIEIQRLELLTGLFSDVGFAGGRVVLIRGEAGIDKTDAATTNEPALLVLLLDSSCDSVHSDRRQCDSEEKEQEVGAD